MAKAVGRALSDKEMSFVREYTIDFNGTQAAIRAGYSKRSANTTAARLLAKDSVIAAVRAAQDVQADRTQVTRDRVVDEYRRIAFLDLRELLTWDKDGCRVLASSELSEDVAAAVSGVRAHTTTQKDSEGNETTHTELELKTHSKLAALNKLAKHLGMFEDTRPVLPGANVVVPTQINVYLPDNKRQLRAEVVSGNGQGD